MIRVFRARTARDLKVSPGDQPVFSVQNPSELDARLESSPLTPAEREAVKRAIASVDNGSADVLLAANGNIFRVERRGEAPRPSGPPATAWASTERGASIVLAHRDEAWCRRAIDAFRFVGYAARVAEKSAMETVLTAPPLVILVPGEVATSELLDAASDRCAVVALVEANEPAPSGAHATLRLPLRFASVAATLDPLIRKARSGRLRLGKATPPP